MLWINVVVFIYEALIEDTVCKYNCHYSQKNVIKRFHSKLNSNILSSLLCTKNAQYSRASECT